MNAIIFGIHGQDGYYLNQLLVDLGIEVIGVSRQKAQVIGSVSDISLVQSLIQKYKPAYIFHFAAVSDISHELVWEHQDTIVKGTLNILQSVLDYSPHSKVFISGSGLQFLNKNLPIQESDLFDPKDAYSLARIQSVYTARYFRSKGIKVYVGYFFNHDSPLRSEKHINQFIVKSALRIKNREQYKLNIRNANFKKEFLFAGDAVKAVWYLVNQDTITETVIGSGHAIAIMEWINYCFYSLNLNIEEHLVIENNTIPSIHTLVSDPATIISLGWNPTLSFEGLADLMLTAGL
ncbi:MAG: GDP-mannose 4,6-dehydratase [Saprospiraceae bacterium]